MRIGILTSGGDTPGMNAAIRAATLVGRSQGADLAAGLAGQIVWCGLLGLLAVRMWRTGLRRYEAVGG